ncbi:MAG: transcriptional regulator, LysR family [Magnetococcales bacterium]|nr:transcriptional regulator, LysR family [Magnetococcales bacterium]HIJ84773.1 LysR family transcriptional regulator [Magnetococcales bacterium]
MHSNKNTLKEVDLNLLVAFDVLMMERSVTQAGRVLGITQAAMSNTLKRLRLTFGDPLFTKRGHSMEPTALALKLAEPIVKALDHAQSLLVKEQFDPASTNRLFRMAVCDCMSSILIPPLLDHLRKAAPGVRLEVVEPEGPNQAKLLDRGESDLLVTWFQWVTADKVYLHRLFEMNCVCVARPGNPHVGEKLTLEGFLAADHVQFMPPELTTTFVDEALLQQGYTRKIVGRFNNSGIIPHLVATSDLLTVFPDRQAHFLASRMNLEVHSLPFSVMPMRIAMAWHARNEESLPERWLRKVIVDLLDQTRQIH